MADLTSILQFLLIDIVALGLLTMVTIGIAVRLWSPQARPFRAVAVLMRVGARRLAQRDASAAGEGDESPPMDGGQFETRVVLAGCLMAAALAGMLTNLVADEVLDSELLIQHLFYVPAFDDLPDIVDGDRSKDWRDEDAIKEKEISKLSERLTGHQREVLGWHFPQVEVLKNLDDMNRLRLKFADARRPISESARENAAAAAKAIDATLPPESLCSEEKEALDILRSCLASDTDFSGALQSLKTLLKETLEYPTKGLFQSAYARVLRDNNSSVVALLNAELVTLKLLRVLFVDLLFLVIVVLILVTFDPFFDRDGLQPEALRGAGSSGPRNRSLLRVAVTGVLLFVALLGVLRAWTDQSERYEKKLIHAYFAVYDSPALMVQPRAVPRTCHQDEFDQRRGSISDG